MGSVGFGIDCRARKREKQMKNKKLVQNRQYTTTTSIGSKKSLLPPMYLLLKYFQDYLP